jgi:epoxide hydrolase-like predicted phosphatase
MDGLLIDWGGVLTTSMLGSFDAFEGRDVRAAFRDDPRARQALFDLENGEIALEVFEQRLGRALDLDPDNLAARLTAHVRPDRDMRAAVRRLHDAGVKTALVSNSWRPDDYDELDMFDVVVLSQREHVRKPDPRIYEIALERLQLPATACVFVDDLGGNLKPAKALGMTTIRHERASDTIPELERLLLARPS